MATYPEVIEALRKADAAGNVEDARKLAEIANSMRVDINKSLDAAFGVSDEIPPQLRMFGDEPTPPTMGEVVKESIGRAVTRIPAAISAAGTYYGTLGESEFPSQLPPQGATEEAMNTFSRGLGLRPELRPATQGQRYAMAFTEGVADPLNLFGLGGVKTGLGLVQKGLLSSEGARVGLQLGAGGTASVGGELKGATSLETSSYMFKHKNLYNAISGGADFEARRIENVSTAHYFVRVNNREFNYSNNPTFVTGSQGDFYNAAFTTDPVVYPTTIGLYNDSNELIAVAKTSKPIAKSFSKEVLVKVKLDF